MTNNGHIIVPKGAKPNLPQVILPNRGSLFTDCDKCSSREFAIRVTPLPEEGCAQIKELVCVKCRKVFSVDDEAKLEGKATAHKDGRIYGKRKGRGSHQHTADSD